MSNQQTIRQHLRRARAAMSPSARAEASHTVAAKVIRHRRFLNAGRVAAYFCSNDEIDPSPIVEFALSSGKVCYMPVLHPSRHGRLLFCRWRPGDRLKTNRFGIPEPVVTHNNLLAASSLDLVITPLLGFDTIGNRVGMGGGYYDRTFAFLRRHTHINRPFLIGIAFACQRVERLQTQPWDVAMNTVITETS
jgi:5-formyltetrahydrofolate cyclo-ligase